MSTNEILISIKPEHSANIFNSKKKYELRRRKLNIERGTKVWIYSTLPNGFIEGWAIVEDIIAGTPDTLWKHLSEDVSLSKVEYEQYFHNCSVGHAIKLNHIHKLNDPLDLVYLRKNVPGGFTPPQFFLHVKEPLSKILNRKGIA
jgi:predicted transcriptional regulator